MTQRQTDTRRSKIVSSRTPIGPKKIKLLRTLRAKCIGRVKITWQTEKRPLGADNDGPYVQVLGQRVLSRQVHLRWRPWLRWARPLPPPRVRLVTMTSEEWDSLTPLPVIPGMKRSVDLTPSAVEQRVPPKEISKEPRDTSTCQKSERAVFPKNKMTVKSVRVQKDRRHLEHQSKQTRQGLVQKHDT